MFIYKGLLPMSSIVQKLFSPALTKENLCFSPVYSKWMIHNLNMGSWLDHSFSSLQIMEKFVSRSIPKTFRHQKLAAASWPVDVTSTPFEQTSWNCFAVRSGPSTQKGMAVYFSVLEVKSANILSTWNSYFYRILTFISRR